MTPRVYLWIALLIAFGAENWWVYTKGKESVFKGVIAGTATFQAKDDKKAQLDVAQAAQDAKTIAQLTAERDALRNKLKNKNANPQTPSAPSVADAGCTPTDDELHALTGAIGTP